MERNQIFHALFTYALGLWVGYCLFSEPRTVVKVEAIGGPMPKQRGFFIEKNGEIVKAKVLSITLNREGSSYYVCLDKKETYASFPQAFNTKEDAMNHLLDQVEAAQ